MKKSILAIFLNVMIISLYAQSEKDTQYSESEMILKTPTGDISGTLTIPGNKNTSAVVLIIAGSGPTDRDCNSPMGIRTNAYKMLAAGLADNGISSVRFDKRGIGKSQSAMKSEADIKFETYINDVVKWISFLKADKRFSRIILLGHSEGSLIGIIAAENSSISAFISIAGVGRSADKVIQEQLRNKLTPQLLQESNRILDSLRMGKTVAKVDPDLVALYRPSVQPYMISWIKYDPSKEIAKMKMPALIIQGTTDLQVTVDDAKLLAASKPGAKVKIIDNMNHVMKECGNDIPQNMASYNNPNLPLKSGLLDEVVNFIKTNK
jgi:pimeloyl-ACP methyl ester carboxylesterase